MTKIVVVSGGFDPCHRGHIEYLYSAKKLGDMLIVGLNSDPWLERKKGKAFMPLTERFSVINALKPVDFAMGFDDDDGSACKLLEFVKSAYPNDKIIFANGGDRTENNIPEMSVSGVSFAFGVGGYNKSNSSSWILNEWKAPKTERQWGYYRVLHETQGMKVKELTVDPGKSLSMQKHFRRAEIWIVSSGRCVVHTMSGQDPSSHPSTFLSQHMQMKIPVGSWHQLTNPYDEPCKIVEIQYGTACDELDIERIALKI
jgi:cytidyltransferase-like protein